MRLPNGFGRITKLSNRNLRNPWRVTVTTSKDEYGKPIGTLLKPKAYFPTYNDAYMALILYNENPYDLNTTVTANELFALWSKQYYPQISEKTQRGYSLAWRYCEKIKDMNVRDIRAKHIKDCCENGTAKSTIGKNKDVPHKASPNMQKNIKILWNLMFQYALERELVDKNYADDVILSKNLQKQINENKEHHVAFTDEELTILWEHSDKQPYVDMLLIQSYMGWRPNEMLDLEIDNINLEEKIIIGGMKTESGTNRTVPIHSLVYPLVKARYNQAVNKNCRFLFSGMRANAKMSYSMYYTKFKEVIDVLDLNAAHRPHDPRKTFITNAKKYNVDEYAIKRIVGHYIGDITEKVYTERDVHWLSSEIEKIKRPGDETQPFSVY